MPAASRQSETVNVRRRRFFLPPLRTVIGPRDGLSRRRRPREARGREANVQVESRQLRPSRLLRPAKLDLPQLRFAWFQFVFVLGHRVRRLRGSRQAGFIPRTALRYAEPGIPALNWRGAPPILWPAVRLAGVNVTLSAAARLAVLVQRNGDMPLATKVGEAVDHLEDDVALTVTERESILEALFEHCPEDLEELRAALIAEHWDLKPEVR